MAAIYGRSIGGPWTEEDDLHTLIPLIPALWSTIDEPQPPEICPLVTALNYRHFELAHRVNVFMFEAALFVFWSYLCLTKPGEFWTGMLD